MHKNDDENYDRQTELLEKFLSKNDRSAFQKILNMNIISNNEKDKEKGRFRNRSHLLKSMKAKPPSYYYDQFQMNDGHPNYHLNVNNTDLYKFNYDNNFKENQISNFKLDFRNILQDPEYKDKCWKGNNKWGSMKFQMMKLNLAKRRGVSIDDLHMAKVGDRKRNNMEMNGQFVMSNNPLTRSMNVGKKNPPNGLRNSIKNRLGKINQEQIIRRQLTQKVKPTVINDDEINKLDINF